LSNEAEAIGGRSEEGKNEAQRGVHYLRKATPPPPPPRDSKKAVTFTEIEAERNAFHWGDGQGSNALGEPQLWGEEVRGSRTWTNL
jgi:hypothetical protein